MRLIDADFVAEEIKDEGRNQYIQNGYVRDRVVEAYSDCLSLVFHSPTIEAEPVRHGDWVPYPSDQYRKCSVCGIEYAKFELLLKYKYCPNCGAKMDGKEKME